MMIVKGYMIRTIEMIEERTELLFTLFPDGTVKSTYRNYSTSFIESDDVWEDVVKLPDDAEFIGDYKFN